jgi:hypothetical protein
MKYFEVTIKIIRKAEFISLAEDKELSWHIKLKRIFTFCKNRHHINESDTSVKMYLRNGEESVNILFTFYVSNNLPNNHLLY